MFKNIKTKRENTMSYTNQTSWKQIMEYLPSDYHFTDQYQPQEEWWEYKGNKLHLDTFRNPQAPAKIIAFHGVGTNGRQISMILGGPQFRNGYETIMIDMPTYGVSVCKDRNSVTYADWVEVGAALIDRELERDDRPIFLYGLSAGGMETYHVAARNPKVKGIIGMTFLDQKNQKVRDETTSHLLMGRVGVPSLTLGKALGLGRLKLPMWFASKMSALVNDKDLLKIFLSDKTSAGNWASINFLQSYMNYVPAISPNDFAVAPVLLTQPDADKWTPYELSLPVIEQIKKVPVEVVHLPNGSHYPVEEEALRKMNASIHSFIQNILSQA